MEKQTYISEEEREKCRKVVEAFAELYELENIAVADVGRYGFVVLKYYKPPHGFEEASTFTDSVSLFHELWEEWLNTQLYLIGRGTPPMERGYQGVYDSLPEEKKTELAGRKQGFAEQAGIEI